MKDQLVLVTGGGGFIGGHLVAALRQQGYTSIRAVDVKPLDEWYQRFDDVENLVARPATCKENCERAAEGAADVYNLAADMGGMGFIENNKALCMLSVLINTHLLHGRARSTASKRFFYASSACVYNADKQTRRQRHRAQGRGRLPRHARRRLRLGEAVQRAHVPPLPRGLRPRHARGPLPQRLRPARHLGRRPREGARPPSAARSSRPSSPASTRSRSGATASRPAASCTSTTASRACRRSWTATSSSRINLGSATSWSPSTSWSTSSRTSPASS